MFSFCFLSIRLSAQDAAYPIVRAKNTDTRQLIFFLSTRSNLVKDFEMEAF